MHEAITVTMRIFSPFFLLSLLSGVALAFRVPTIIHDALFGNSSHSPYQGASTVPSDFDFWHSIKDVGAKVNAYKGKILGDAAAEYASAAYKLNEFKDTMSRVVTGTKAMGTILQEVPDNEEFQHRFEVHLARAFEELKEEFSGPLPEDRTERYRQQASMISQGLDKIEDALVNVFGFWEIPEAAVRAKFDDIKPHMNNVLLDICNLVNNHPDLFETLLLSAAIMIIEAEIPILLPILRFFGIDPFGPIKGSIAASAQRFFFGGQSKKVATKLIAIKRFFWAVVDTR